MITAMAMERDAGGITGVWGSGLGHGEESGKTNCCRTAPLNFIYLSTDYAVLALLAAGQKRAEGAKIGSGLLRTCFATSRKRRICVMETDLPPTHAETAEQSAKAQRYQRFNTRSGEQESDPHPQTSEILLWRLISTC